MNVKKTLKRREVARRADREWHLLRFRQATVTETRDEFVNRRLEEFDKGRQ